MSERYRVKFLYRFLLRTGDMLAARKVLQLLLRGSITLGFSKFDWNITLVLEKVLTPAIPSHGLLARFQLKKGPSVA